MAYATVVDTTILNDLSGKPMAFTCQWKSDNYNSSVSIPMFGDVFKAAYTQGARIIHIDGISVYHAGTIGVIMRPLIYSGDTNTIHGNFQYQATARAADVLVWDTKGWPLTLSEALQKAVIGSIVPIGYAATDDMVIVMWGRFL